MKEPPKPTDFTIESAPVNIRFQCPHCGMDVKIPWKQLNPPEYWGDQWDDVTCPDCEKTVTLGGCDYD